MSRVYPQLTREDAVAVLTELEDRLKRGEPPRPFPDGTLDPRTRFASFGGPPVSISRLRELHSSLAAALSNIPIGGREANRRFDTIAGSFLVDWFDTDGQGQASNPEIWPYLTLLVLPDLAVRRFGPSPTGRLPRERYLSDRRNIFYRAYLRSWILGDLLDDPDLPIYEDDLVGLVDRSFSANHRVARFIAAQIRALSNDERRNRGGLKGVDRRTLVREGLKAVQFELRVTDLSSLDDPKLEYAITQAFRTIDIHSLP